MLRYDRYPYRRSLRLRDYDYSLAGAYYVTVCTHERECLFGDVADGQMRHNYPGQIVVACWNRLPIHFANVELDAFVVMPNHVHGILFLLDRAYGPDLEDVADTARANNSHQTISPSKQPGTANYSPLHPPHGTVPSSLGAVVQTFKKVAARKINQIRGTPGCQVWQRSYYDRIIRDDDELVRVRQYILRNPASWQEDVDRSENRQA